MRVKKEYTLLNYVVHSFLRIKGHALKKVAGLLKLNKILLIFLLVTKLGQ